MSELEKAQKKYQEYLRNYYHFKDMHEEYYCSNNSFNLTKKQAKENEVKMNHAFDVLEVLKFIFGEKVRG